MNSTYYPYVKQAAQRCAYDLGYYARSTTDDPDKVDELFQMALADGWFKDILKTLREGEVQYWFESGFFAA